MDIRRNNRPLILASVMMGMFLAAIEATIVATAMPTIVSDLGGFSLYSWVFSAYLLPNAATILIFGKLADTYGRKPIFVIGILIFLTGSTICGFSQAMEWLIMARFIQGLGAGAMMPMATTIVGDIYTKVERAKIQGYLSAVWGISAISGPLLGGFFVDFLDWRFVFWMNIPLGLLAMLGILLFFNEKAEKESQSIDYLSSIWIVITVCIVMIIFVEGGSFIPWTSPLMFILLGIAVFTLFLFVRQQRISVNPTMPLEIWNDRFISLANLTTLITGMIIMGVSSYLPTYVQGVLGYSATIAGFTLTTMSIGWPLAAVIAGRTILTISYRITSLYGGIFLIAGSLMFFMLSPERGPLWAAAGSFFIGVGMGLTSTSFTVGIQSSVTWNVRGIATATNMFMRTLGSALGVALLGGLLNNRIKKEIEVESAGEDVSINSANLLLDPIEQQTLSEDALIVLKSGLSSGLHVVYIGVLFLAVLSFIFIFFMPKHVKEVE